MLELISVVIPAYNRADIIGKCIDSVLNQTYDNIEVIVVDDCSTDNTVSVVNSIKDHRIICYQLDSNHGACFARNYGVERANGQYIAFQDSDDIWVPDKLEKQMQYLEKGNYDLVFCGMRRISEKEKEEFYYPPIVFDESKDALYQILFENRISTQCILMRKAVFEKVKFDVSIKRFQDWDFAINVARYFGIGYINEALVISEIQENSISKNANRFNALSVIYDKHLTDIQSNAMLHSRFLYKFAEEIRNSDLRKASKYYKESLKCHFRLKTFIKYIITAFGID